MAFVQKSGPLTLEQVYQLQSDWRAYGGRKMSPKPLQLTALAQQACRQEGIDPHDLMFREIWQFAEPNVSEEIQLMRHAAFMQLREEKMECVLKARDSIISARAHREALSKAVEAKVRATIGEESKVREVDLGRTTESSARSRLPATFPDSDGFAALYSQVHTGGDAIDAGASVESPRWKKRQVNEILARAKAIEAKRKAFLDAELKRREDEAMLRLEHQELLRETEMKTRSDVREHRIRSAVVAAKAVEERRQRRARRKIIKKFLKSAALQMTTLEDVEKEAELKVLREQKRRDYVARAEMKHEFRIAQIQDRIREKEDRARAQEEARRDMERRAKVEAQKESLARQQLLKVDVEAALRSSKAAKGDIVSQLLSMTSPVRGVGSSGLKGGHGGAGHADAASRSTFTTTPKLFVSPASFPSFGVWMLLQHFKIKHDVINVQILDEAARDGFAAHYSPLIPSIVVGGEVVSGVQNAMDHLVHCEDALADIADSLWPTTGHAGLTMRKIMELAGPLYYRVLQYVLPLLTPLMRPWEVALADADLGQWESLSREEADAAAAAAASSIAASTRDGDEGSSADSAGEAPAASPSDSKAILDAMTLEQLVKLSIRMLANSGDVFMLGRDVSIADFTIIPAFHMLLLVGYPLPEQILDYLAVFASVVPELIELEEPLCVLFQRFSGPASEREAGSFDASGVFAPAPYSPAKHTRARTAVY